MLLTIRTTHTPATDLGFLLHKHPDHVHTREFPFGNATVFYPEASEDACTAALALDVDPVGMVRGRGGKGGAEDQYVNDRPYVASSLLSVVLRRWFNSALSGRCERKPDLPGTPLPLEARLAVLPCRGGEPFLRRLFEPLGYEVDAVRHPLDDQMPALGPSRIFTVTLRATRLLSELLTHLYVLIPVLDDQKHYWVGDDDVEKLLRRGEGWLETHPARDEIVSRYLVHQRGLVRDAIARLTAEEQPEEEAVAAQKDEQEASIERTISLNERRLDSVVEALKTLAASRVLDLGCGEGKLLRRLLADPQFTEIVGMDVAIRVLEQAESRLKLDRLAPLFGPLIALQELVCRQPDILRDLAQQGSERCRARPLCNLDVCTATNSDSSLGLAILEQHAHDFLQMALQFIEGLALAVGAGPPRDMSDEQAAVGIAFDDDIEGSYGWSRPSG